MARPVVRIGDINSAGGVAITPVPKVTANGRPFARFMSIVTPHPPCPFVPIHCVARAALPGSSRVTAGGSRVLRIGDTDTCGHPRVTGSRNVTAG
jgi:uncharacterized Zn-binding protein involved in type VI secretion